MTEETKLKPCPKCGSDNAQAVGKSRIGFISYKNIGITHYVRCDNCGFEVSSITEGLAIDKWNMLAKKVLSMEQEDNE